MSALDTAAALTTIGFAWRLERRDGAGLALSSHDAVVTIDGVRHAPSPGMSPAAIIRRGGLAPTSGEIEGMISGAALTEEDLELGRWDGARVTLAAFDWSGVGDPLRLIDGELGAVGISGEGFSAELVGAAAKLEAPVCPLTSPECRAELGDGQCRVDMAGRRIEAIASGSDGSTITLAVGIDEGFAYGRLFVLSGAASGWSSTIVAIEDGMPVLRDPPRVAIAPGARLWIEQGCDKRFATCRDRFANAANFRGEPHLPGNDLLTRYPGG
jgi:uncharacterized phage protein (TIGR02218 family)